MLVKFQIYPLFLTIFIILFRIEDGVYACNLSAVNQCVVLLNSSTSADVLNEGLSTIPPTEILMQLCRARETYKACSDPLSADCSNNFIFSMTFGIIDKTLTYLCVEGYNAAIHQFCLTTDAPRVIHVTLIEILKHEQCWNQTGVKNGTMTCHAQQNEMISVLRRRSNEMDNTALRNNWCSILDNTSSCMTDAVANMCGPAPACIMQTMITRALAGLADLMRCALVTDCSNLIQETTKITHIASSTQRTTNQMVNIKPPNLTTELTSPIEPIVTANTTAADVSLTIANDNRGDKSYNNKAPDNASIRTEPLFFPFYLLCLFLYIIECSEG